MHSIYEKMFLRPLCNIRIELLSNFFQISQHPPWNKDTRKTKGILNSVLQNVCVFALLDITQHGEPTFGLCLSWHWSKGSSYPEDCRIHPSRTAQSLINFFFIFWFGWVEWVGGFVLFFLFALGPRSFGVSASTKPLTTANQIWTHNRIASTLHICGRSQWGYPCPQSYWNWFVGTWAKHRSEA